MVLCCTMWVISGCSFCVTSFFFHHQALYGPMATWLEFPYECSPRELEVVRIVCPLCTIKKKKNDIQCVLSVQAFHWCRYYHAQNANWSNRELGTNRSCPSNPRGVCQSSRITHTNFKAKVLGLDLYSGTGCCRDITKVGGSLICFQGQK